MKKVDFLKYKNYPEGSPSKRIYDSYYLSFQDYLDKYYRDEELNRWNEFLEKYVYPLFDKHKRNEYSSFLKKMKPAFVIEFNSIDEFWQNVKGDSRFDEELKCFFTFLHVCNFFSEYNISFECWLNMENWISPWSEKDFENSKTIMKILDYKFGDKYLKSALIGMPWINKR